MTKRGRPRVSWQHLRDRNAKPSVWKRRQLEDEPPAPVVPTVEPPARQVDPELLAEYLTAVDRERETFLQRCAPGEILTREHGSGFDWPDANATYKRHGAIFGWSPCLLTDCRNYARKVVADPENSGEWATELSTRFLADLATTDHGCIFDVEAAKNCERMIKIWSDPENPVPLLCTLAMLEFLCWKKSDGENRFADELLLDFYPPDIKFMDAAFSAQKAAQI